MKYEVTYSYHTTCTVVVEADSSEEAINLGYEENADAQILANLVEDGSPIVEYLIK